MIFSFICASAWNFTRFNRNVLPHSSREARRRHDGFHRTRLDGGQSHKPDDHLLTPLASAPRALAFRNAAPERSENSPEREFLREWVRACGASLTPRIWREHPPLSPALAPYFYGMVQRAAISTSTSSPSADCRKSGCFSDIRAFDSQKGSIGLDAAAVYVPHPLQNKTTAKLYQWAEAAIDEILRAITHDKSGVKALEMA
jgi:hypothetical protein